MVKGSTMTFYDRLNFLLLLTIRHFRAIWYRYTSQDSNALRTRSRKLRNLRKLREQLLRRFLHQPDPG